MESVRGRRLALLIVESQGLPPRRGGAFDGSLRGTAPLDPLELLDLLDLLDLLELRLVLVLLDVSGKWDQ